MLAQKIEGCMTSLQYNNLSTGTMKFLPMFMHSFMIYYDSEMAYSIEMMNLCPSICGEIYFHFMITKFS
jgi:hypothetical protein